MKKNNFEKGFTLLEILVALAIFVSIASAVSTIFINVLRSQQRSFRFQEVQDNGSYIMEMIAREIRMSGIIMPDYNAGDDDTLTIMKNDIVAGNTIIYSLDGSNIMRQVNSEIALQINSDKVRVNNLHFYVSNIPSVFFGNSNYRRVTIILGLESASDPTTNINLQTTITSRPPPCASGICQPIN